MPGANVRIGAARVTTSPDSRALIRTSAIATSVQACRWKRAVSSCLIKIHTVGAKAIVTITTTAKFTRISVVTATVVSFAEVGIMGSSTTFKRGVTCEGVGNVDECDWAQYITNRISEIRS